MNEKIASNSLHITAEQPKNAQLTGLHQVAPSVKHNRTDIFQCFGLHPDHTGC